MIDMMSPLERRVEAIGICSEIDGCPLNRNEREFFNGISNPQRPVSSSQLQWLRDIQEKYRVDV